MSCVRAEITLIEGVAAGTFDRASTEMSHEPHENVMVATQSARVQRRRFRQRRGLERIGTPPQEVILLDERVWNLL